MIRSVRLPNGLPCVQYRLENGLNLYVVENRAAPVFHIQTWFGVGSRDEKLDPRLRRTGLAHLFEHMMFRGTKRHADGEFDEILTRNGARDENATTWLDRTNYYQSLPSSKLELVLELESDRMANLALDHDLLETEKGAVLGEYRMGKDDPSMVAYERLYETAFTAHPYRCTTIGTEEEIQGFTVEEAEYFYRKYYAPDNATILIVGAVDPAEAARLVAKHYGAYAPQAVAKAPAPREPEQVALRRTEFTHAQLTEPKLLVAHHAPEARHPDQPALWVLDSVLTTGMGALLQEAWIDAGITVSADGGLDQFQDPGLHVLSADLQPDRDPEEALAALDRVLAGLGGPGFADEVERARNQLLLAMLRGMSDNEGIASFMGEYILSAGDPLFAFEQLAAVENVTAEQVLRAARQYFDPARRTVVIGRPSEATVAAGGETE